VRTLVRTLGKIAAGATPTPNSECFTWRSAGKSSSPLALSAPTAYKERIPHRIESELDIGEYALTLGVRSPAPGFVIPVKDALFWFGSGNLVPGDWIFLYTGAGTPSVIPPDENVHGRLLVVYWGRSETVFHDPQIVPVIWHVGGMRTPPVPKAVRQVPALTTSDSKKT
jgi:hypothetical protein